MQFGKLLRLGYSRTLEYPDLFDTPDALKTRRVYKSFADTFNAILEESREKAARGDEKEAKRIADAEKGLVAAYVLKTVWRRHRLRIGFAMMLQLCYSAVQFVGPLMLNNIIKILTNVCFPDVDCLGLYVCVLFLSRVLSLLPADESE